MLYEQMYGNKNNSRVEKPLLTKDRKEIKSQQRKNSSLISIFGFKDSFFRNFFCVPKFEESRIKVKF